MDSVGNVYIADSEDEVIRKVSNGTITTVAGNGIYGYSGDNGPATSAQLAHPSAVTVDSVGNLYIGDTDNHCIRKVSNGNITTVAGNGTSGFSGDNGLATNAQMTSTTGIAVDSAGNLYIGDRENARIRKVSNGIITTVVGSASNQSIPDSGMAVPPLPLCCTTQTA